MRQPKTTIEIPTEAFYRPTPEEFDRNPGYWGGYSAGQGVVAALPSPAGSGDYETYRSWFGVLYLPTSDHGWVDNMAVGYNAAIADAANWLWRNDPQSPFVVPPSY